MPRAPKQRTTTLKLKFNQAGRLDTDPTMLDVAETSNVVLSPDGSEAMPRPGYVVNRHYNALPPVGQEGRKVIMIDRFPGNGVALTQHMIINSATGSIDALHYTKEPTIAAGEAVAGIIELVPATDYDPAKPANSVDLGTVTWPDTEPNIFSYLPHFSRSGNITPASQANPFLVDDPTGFAADHIVMHEGFFSEGQTDAPASEIQVNVVQPGEAATFPVGLHVEATYEYSCNDGISEMSGNALYTVRLIIGTYP